MEIIKKSDRKELNVVYKQKFYNRKEASDIYRWLEDNIEYNSDEDSMVMIHGKMIKIPRKQVAHGDPGTSYSFSGNTVPTKPWTPELLEIKRKVEEYAGETFNFVLINRYKDGSHYIGYHSDDEKELGDTPTIASITFGAARDFLLKKIDGSEPLETFKLHHGDLLLMKHPTNDKWKHSVPKRLKVKKPRINLTFRRIYL